VRYTEPANRILSGPRPDRIGTANHSCIDVRQCDRNQQTSSMACGIHKNGLPKTPNVATLPVNRVAPGVEKATEVSQTESEPREYGGNEKIEDRKPRQARKSTRKHDATLAET
jgi:hypothetical protein